MWPTVHVSAVCHVTWVPGERRRPCTVAVVSGRSHAAFQSLHEREAVTMLTCVCARCLVPTVGEGLSDTAELSTHLTAVSGHWSGCRIKGTGCCASAVDSGALSRFLDLGCEGCGSGLCVLCVLVARPTRGDRFAVGTLSLMLPELGACFHAAVRGNRPGNAHCLSSRPHPGRTEN